MKKQFNLSEVLREASFNEVAIQSEVLKRCNGVMLQRDWEKEIEVVWYGKQTQTFSIRVFINLDSGICHVAYTKSGILYKERWYDTIGKRTYNAIVETARCADFEF